MHLEIHRKMVAGKVGGGGGGGGVGDGQTERETDR